MSLLSKPIPARHVSPLIAGDILLQRVKRRVRSGVGHVGEEGLAFVDGLVDHRHGVVADGIGVVEVRGVDRDQRVVPH